MSQPSSASAGAPPFRRLRGYAFDPSLSTQLETAVLNEVVFKVPWEKRKETVATAAGERTVGVLEPGPVGEYLEVVDFDPASGCFYAPVDLADPHVLGQDGLRPSEGNPQFHQQMVYAVAMTTIRNFEHALGRRALWAPRLVRFSDPEGPAEEEAQKEIRARRAARVAKERGQKKKDRRSLRAAPAKTGSAESRESTESREAAESRESTEAAGLIAPDESAAPREPVASGASNAAGVAADTAANVQAPPAEPNPDRVVADEYVPRLRIYPHALRQANAYYSPEKKALLFGYFPAGESDPGQHYPGGMVFTCLSHDIVAHETTHALLDGMHRRFVESTHPDGLAFHEAFADIVALFQHFSFPEVLRHQIAKTRGDLASQSLLGELAQEFGRAMGSYGALRSAIGRVNPETKAWEPLEPDPSAYRTVLEPHERGAILVAAVFDAFLSIYRSRVADLFRIATGGSGVLAPGALHPDLVNRLADEAAKTAQHVLNMCVRALDYCPPVDITFGDYLRAVITADYDLVRDDDRGYRVAFIEAFRRRGIYPRDVRTLSEDTLRWKASHEEVECDLGPVCRVLRKFVEEHGYLAAIPPTRPKWLDDRRVDWDALSERERMYHTMDEYARQLNNAVNYRLDRAAFAKLTGLWLRNKGDPRGDGDEPDPAGLRFRRDGRPVLEVHSVRPAQRVSPDGELLNEVVIALTQRRKVPVNPAADRLVDDAWRDSDDMEAAVAFNGGTVPVEGFWYRGGCTLILDLKTQRLRYAVVKRINSENRLKRQRKFKTEGAAASLRTTYFGRPDLGREPFAFLHASHEQEP
jgi:hypothetical protein